jgi:signal transduction histidine kinase
MLPRAIVASTIEGTPSTNLIWQRILLLVICCILLGGCRSRPAGSEPSVEFSSVPRAEQGGTPKLDTIEGRVVGARPGQRIVLFARSGAWYVQPFTDQPFTELQPDSTWRNSTHLGTEYAALLVEPEYSPPARMDELPKQGDGVVAVTTAPGEPVFWRKWWFRLAVGVACVFALLALYRFRLRRVTRRLNLRFEERLAERTRIAQELHDTLFQGVLSVSMQLHMTVDNLPEDSPARTPLLQLQQLLGQVIEEGRNTVRGLRSDGNGSLNLEEAFSRIRQDFAVEEQIAFRVIVEGRPRPLHPIIRDDIYRIGREALGNAFRHSNAKSIKVEVKYLDNQLRVLVRDDGHGIDSRVLRAGREGHRELSGMRERAERIGGRLKVRSRAALGTEVELSVPAHVAFQTHERMRPPGLFARLYTRKAAAGTKRSSGRVDV